MTLAENDVQWFPVLQRALPAAAQDALPRTIAAAWLLLIDGNALLEDFEGAAGEADLTEVLKLRLAELFVEIDLTLDGANDVDELHFLPLALDFGLHTLGHLDGDKLIALLQFGADESDPHARLLPIWENILDAFPGEVPNPLLADGQGDVLRALQNWSRLCRAAEVDDSFLAPLVQAV
ncbi:DUF6031 family protein [Roseobacter weihaiensis]|uniref:DUF6031 family protein n=1 Tax=Roseobacter weihaiensis TaxID=2763262 RepID=UPI001D0BA28A|nr:DUF6031 family protein [Roseobacter sp. H9]